jgi:hypothetical protein
MKSINMNIFYKKRRVNNEYIYICVYYPFAESINRGSRSNTREKLEFTSQIEYNKEKTKRK